MPSEHSGFLIDTHVLLWLTHGETSRIPPQSLEALTQTTQGLNVSIASLWEMTIKRSLGKLSFDSSLFDQLESHGYHILPITRHHLKVLDTLPKHHTDPFDRIMIAQCLSEQLTFATSDREIEPYNCKVLRC